MILKSLEINKWNQFDKITLEFNPKLTIITGANGSGKSTIIRLISRVMGWEYNETATPLLSTKESYRFLSGITLNILNEFLNEEQNQQHLGVNIGNLLTNQGQINIYVPKQAESAIYSVNFHPYLQLKGVNIPSHRIQHTYKPIKSIPVKPRTKKEAFNLFNESFKKRTMSMSYYNPTEDDPTAHIKATLMSLAVFGKGNEFVTNDDRAYELFVGFVRVLKLLLPETLGFKELKVKDGEIILVTETGHFLIDSVSGGIGAIIDLAWQIYMYDDNETESFVVLLDEAENHLHPSMQRSLLPNLLEAFPNVQFVVTTHSPFMVNSVQDSTVYVLNYNDDKKVVTEKLDFINKAGNASEILRDVLGVPVTLPVWVEKKLNSIAENYSYSNLTPETYQRLKTELSEIGLNDYLPDALGIIGGGQN
ncbi:AAA domain [Schinkia azotoformans MEV2011]|uniref:AAA domain n=1 Tax=Schinkia azotoformans MEV2011 TaxID=1348973 RepID=A0A072NSC1_SCHAZ|nr:ATP-binding protein [Schinkia azotoformans]KEF40386.1 AAA domain [Schinkia azotoformans MEV2011]MEC1696201.1 AAA family ATPase [Schinkia azotoformans]MEC1725296.1 AAA family ATPase [Schinkia azotoformans]